MNAPKDQGISKAQNARTEATSQTFTADCTLLPGRSKDITANAIPPMAAMISRVERSFIIPGV